MADIISVAINKNSLQKPEEWNSLINYQGIDISINERFSPFDHVGYIDCKYNGKRTGFEFEISEINLSDFNADILKRIEKYDSLINITLRDGIKSFFSACAIASAIAQAGGVILDSDNSIVSADEAFKWTKEQIENYNQAELKKKEIKKERTKLQKSPEAIHEKLLNLIYSIQNYKQLQSIRSGIYLALAFENGISKIAISTKNWEFHSANECLQKSKDLLVYKHEDPEKSQAFFVIFEQCLQESTLDSITFSQNNELTLNYSNGYKLICFPFDTLKFRKDFYAFSINKDQIDVYV